MFPSLRQSSRKLRLWLIATAAVLLLTSLLEAGHGHGGFTASDDSCILCQHSVALDQTLAHAISILVPLLLMVFAISRAVSPVPYFKVRSTHIRAPPVQFHTR